jgi:hypothetical protein
MPLWYHYHSVLEFTAAIDLAIVALPNLREPALAAETSRWDRLAKIISLDDPKFAETREAMWQFVSVKRDLETKIESVRSFAAFLVAVCAIVLVYGTVNADQELLNPGFLWIAVGVSLTPVVIVCGLDREARRRIRASSRVRQSLENEIIGS